VARRMAEHSKKRHKVFAGCWDVDESRECGLISEAHLKDFFDFVRKYK
jgi:hypothetical protein